jgi:hypothetical protein
MQVRKVLRQYPVWWSTCVEIITVKDNRCNSSWLEVLCKLFVLLQHISLHLTIDSRSIKKDGNILPFKCKYIIKFFRTLQQIDWFKSFTQSLINYVTSFYLGFISVNRCLLNCCVSGLSYQFWTIPLHRKYILGPLPNTFTIHVPIKAAENRFPVNLTKSQNRRQCLWCIPNTSQNLSICTIYPRNNVAPVKRLRSNRQLILNQLFACLYRLLIVWFKVHNCNYDLLLNQIENFVWFNESFLDGKNTLFVDIELHVDCVVYI